MVPLLSRSNSSIIIDDCLRILSVIDHNEQQLTLYIGKISPDDANGPN